MKVTWVCRYVCAEREALLCILPVKLGGASIICQYILLIWFIWIYYTLKWLCIALHVSFGANPPHGPLGEPVNLCDPSVSWGAAKQLTPIWRVVPDQLWRCVSKQAEPRVPQFWELHGIGCAVRAAGGKKDKTCFPRRGFNMISPMETYTHSLLKDILVDGLYGFIW